MIPDQVNSSSMFGNAECMVLHARTASNVSEDQHLG